MTTRSYGQYCGLAHALEVVGERWALLVVRDLLLGPKRFTDLRHGLARIPSNVLSARLKELEQAGVVRRRVLPRPATAVVYELTEYGRELEDILICLGLWGAKSLGEPRPGDTVTTDALMLGMRATFRPAHAQGLQARFQIRLDELVVHAYVDDGALAVGEGSISDPDLVIDTDLRFRSVMAGEITPDDAVEQGIVRLDGKTELLERFVEIFHLPRVEPPSREATSVAF